MYTQDKPKQNFDSRSWENVDITADYFAGLMDAVLTYSVTIQEDNFTNKSRVKSYLGFNFNSPNLKRFLEVLFNPSSLTKSDTDKGGYYRITDNESCFFILNVIQWLVQKKKVEVEKLLQIFTTSLYYQNHLELRYDGYLDDIARLKVELDCSNCIEFPEEGPNLEYLAGFLDYRGYLRITKRAKPGTDRFKYGTEIVISDKNLEFLLWLQKSIDGRIDIGNNTFSLVITSKKVLELLSAIRPFMHESGEIADTLVELQQYFECNRNKKILDQEFMETMYKKSRQYNSNLES